MCSLSRYVHWGCRTQGNISSTHIIPPSRGKMQDPGTPIPPNTALSCSQLTAYLSVFLRMKVTPSHSYCCRFTDSIMLLARDIIPVVHC